MSVADTASSRRSSSSSSSSPSVRAEQVEIEVTADHRCDGKALVPPRRRGARPPPSHDPRARLCGRAERGRLFPRSSQRARPLPGPPGPSRPCSRNSSVTKNGLPSVSRRSLAGQRHSPCFHLVAGQPPRAGGDDVVVLEAVEPHACPAPGRRDGGAPMRSASGLARASPRTPGKVREAAGSAARRVTGARGRSSAKRRLVGPSWRSSSTITSGAPARRVLEQAPPPASNRHVALRVRVRRARACGRIRAAARPARGVRRHSSPPWGGDVIRAARHPDRGSRSGAMPRSTAR